MDEPRRLTPEEWKKRLRSKGKAEQPDKPVSGT